MKKSELYYAALVAVMNSGLEDKVKLEVLEELLNRKSLEELLEKREEEEK